MTKNRDDIHDAVVVRRPLVGLFIGLLAGIALGYFVGVLFWLGVIGVSVSLFGAWFGRRHAFSVLFIHFSVFMLGWMRADMALQNPSSQALGIFLRQEREHVSVFGVVADDPVMIDHDIGNGKQVWSFPFSVEAIQRTAPRQTAHGSLDVYWQGERPPVYYGQQWQLTGLLVTEQRKFRTSDGRLMAEPNLCQFVAADRGSRIMDFCIQSRRRCATLLSLGIEDYPREGGFLRAMLLGIHEDMPDELYRAFSQTGTLHIVAISGTHVAVMAMLFVLMLKTFGMTRPWWIVGLAPLLTIYTLSTGMAASAVRACIMALLFWAAYPFRKKPDAPTALALAAMGILFYSPLQLVDAGFLLSFVVVAGLLWLYPVFYRWLDRFNFRGDPWQLPQQQPRWLSWIHRGTEMVIKLLAASLAAWLASVPLVIFYFNTFTPIVILANLIVIPLSFFILFTGCLTLAVGFFWSFGAEIFNHANRVLISWLLHIIQAFDALPWSHFFVKTPTVFWITILYLLAFMAFCAWRHRPIRNSIAAIASVVLGFVFWSYADDQRIRIHAVPVGSVNCALIDMPGSSDVLVDTGPAFGHRKLIRYLHAQGVDSLRALMISRPTADAMGGATSLLDAIPVRELWLTQTDARSKHFKDLLRVAADRKIALREIKSGDAGIWPGDLAWEILPSGFFRFASGAHSATFMSEIDAHTEQHILQQPIDVSSEALIFGSLQQTEMCPETLLNDMASRYAFLNTGVYGLSASKAEHLINCLMNLNVEPILLEGDEIAVLNFTEDSLHTTQQSFQPYF